MAQPQYTNTIENHYVVQPLLSTLHIFSINIVKCFEYKYFII
jgi:hypothetical protein